MRSFAPEQRIESWQEFVDTVSSLDRGWVFRGGLDHWVPQTSLERACRAWKIPARIIPDAERRLIREFRRHPEVHQLGIEPDDDLGWFAVMQHYGAPSRLLDWTYSPFIAAYFAFDALFTAAPRANRDPTRAAVWAFNATWLESSLHAQFSREDWALYQDNRNRESFAKLYVDRVPSGCFVSAATPLRMDERLSIQQGVFLCPGDVSRTWLDNLLAVGFTGDRSQVRSFVMARHIMPDAFAGLLQMNVTGRSLFPGLDGYARSMNHRLKLLLEIPLSEERGAPPKS